MQSSVPEQHNEERISALHPPELPLLFLFCCWSEGCILQQLYFYRQIYFTWQLVLTVRLVKVFCCSKSLNFKHILVSFLISSTSLYFPCLCFILPSLTIWFISRINSMGQELLLYMFAQRHLNLKGVIEFWLRPLGTTTTKTHWCGLFLKWEIN